MNTSMLRAFGLVAALLLSAACGGDSVGPSNSNGNSNGNVNNNQIQNDLVGAAGVTITEIAVYQGPRCSIMSGGLARVCDVPLINGRDALFRVFYTADPSVVGSTVLGKLEIGPEHTYEVGVDLVAASTEADINSTLNFVVPGDAIDQFLQYKVGFLLYGQPSQDNPAARFPAAGVQSVTVDGIINRFRVVLAPFAYCADGSCREPNLGPAEVAAYGDRFKQLYPVTDVVISKRDAYQWNSYIGPDGSGWQQVGMTLANFRSQDGNTADVYYYGIFNPAASLMQFCGGGCLLGVTLLNSSPPPEGSPQLRFALGVGFDEVGKDTAAHELGHAHGLEHVNCGMGIDPASVDHNYPYSVNSIGVWSWDIVGEELINPDTKTDIMGYCENQWISDYHYNKLYNRGMYVNLPRVTEPLPALKYRLLAVDGRGGGTLNDHITKSQTEVRGEAVSVLVHTAAGPQTVTGQFFRWDHLPGGIVYLPAQPQPIERAELTLRGVPTVVVAP